MPDPDYASPEEPSGNTSGSPAPAEPEPVDCSKYPPRGECSTDVDELACIAKGDKAKADYNETFVSRLQTAKTDYDTTREAYRKERDKDRAVVEDLRNQIRHLVERIGCQIEQKRVRRCLDDALRDVLEELSCCPTTGGCCVGDCDFPLDGIDELAVQELDALIIAYQHRTDEAAACFATLTAEPTNLAARVEAIKTAVNDLNSAQTGDQATLDLKRLYADALTAQWLVDNAWGGFSRRHDFLDCLCDALTCWTKGCEAVYKLTGARAIAQCKAEARVARCELLRTKTADQILSGYERICGKSGCEEDDRGRDEDDHEHEHEHEDEHGDGHDCGCHHHDHDCGCRHHSHHEHEQRQPKDCGCHGAASH